MPKPIDEDRARRKKALEEKREARRVAKLQREKERKDEVVSEAATKEVVVTGPCLLLEMKDDCWKLMISFMSSADVGKLIMTSRTALNMFAPEQYLLSRIQAPPTAELCPTLSSEDAQTVLRQSYYGGETGRVPSKRKKAENHDFLAYSRFVEQSVHGINFVKPNLPTTGGGIVSVSPEHSLCRAFDGVASWGVGKRGQLGHGKRRDEKEPKLLHHGIGYSVRIVQVAAGGGLVRVAHSLLLTDFGRVLSFGTGQYGALGHGYNAAKQLPDLIKPKYIERLQSIVGIAAGELHSAAVSKDGDIYTWGDGFCGQLGHGDKRPQLVPLQVTAGDLEDECIASVACGSRHTIVVTEDGEVFSWGLGHFGVLGRSFTPFDYDADAAVVALGGDELNNDGGDNRVDPLEVIPAPVHDPQAELREHLDLIANLSLEDSSDQCIPVRVESLKSVKIAAASAGHRHTLFLDEHGGVYSCGAGNAGCLGHGDTESQMLPMRITCLDGTRIRRISAGVDISMAVSTTGQPFAWGRTNGGRIGLGLARGEILFPRQVVIGDPETGEPLKAVDVECGYVHSIIVALNGTMHICGGVGVDGAADGQERAEDEERIYLADGKPRQIPNFNIWHPIPEPKDEVVPKPKYKKYGKYEIRGRSKMMSGEE